MAATLTYGRGVSSSEYFKLYNCTPYIVRTEYNDMYCNEIHMIINIGRAPKLPYQLPIECEEYVSVQPSIVVNQCGAYLAPHISSQPVRSARTLVEIDRLLEENNAIRLSLVSERAMIKKREENNDMTRRSNFYLGIMSMRMASMHTILIGDRNIGKTSLVKFLLGYKCVVVENINEDLLKFRPSIHRGIIFENIDLRNIDPSYVTYLVCCPDRTIRYNNETVHIPPDTQLIFTTSMIIYRMYMMHARS